MAEKFICPLPQVWNEIYQKLVLACDEAKSASISKPPVPLILNGWTFSSDKEKSIRWKETVEWAKTYGFQNLISKLNESESYFGNPDDTFNYGNDFVSDYSAEELALAAAGILRLPEESEVSASFLKEKRAALKSETAIKAITDERDED